MRDDRKIAALVEWRLYVEDTLDNFFDILISPTVAPLMQRARKAASEWESLSQSVRVDLVMDICEQLAASFGVEAPRFFTKNSWLHHQKGYGYEDNSYFKNREDFAFYVIDQDWKNPAIAMNWTPEYVTLRGLAGVVAVMAHEFGHYLHDVITRCAMTPEIRQHRVLLSENYPSDEVLNRLPTFAPYSIEKAFESEEKNPREEFEAVWDDESVTAFDRAVVNLDYPEIFEEAVADAVEDGVEARFYAALWWSEQHDEKTLLAQIPALYDRAKAGMDKSAQKFGFELPGHDLVPAYKNRHEFKEDFVRVMELCRALREEFGKMFRACDPAKMKAYRTSDISALSTPSRQMAGLAGYVEMLARKI
jgi:hypothetical protein